MSSKDSHRSIEYADGGRTRSSPAWWYHEWANPHRCNHQKNKSHLCRHLECPIKRRAFSYPLAWWKNKETCSYRESPDPVKYTYMVSNRRTGISHQIAIRLSDLNQRYGNLAEKPYPMMVKDKACKLGLFSWEEYTQLYPRKVSLEETTQAAQKGAEQ